MEFGTASPLAPRACQCSFCRKHGARTVTDPDGAAVLTLGPETLRYRFGTGTTDFLICGRCGVYVGALAEFDDPRPALAAAPVSCEGEGAVAKANRRRAKWTPARLADWFLRPGVRSDSGSHLRRKKNLWTAASCRA